MLIKVIKQWNRLQESWCRLHLRKYSRHYTLFPQKFLSRVTESGKTMGGCKFGNILPIIVQKCYRGYSLNFLTQQFQTRQTIIIWNPISTFFSDIDAAMKTPFQDRINYTNFHRSQDVSKNTKIWDSPRNWRIGSSILHHGVRSLLWKQCWKKNSKLEKCWGENEL